MGMLTSMGITGAPPGPGGAVGGGMGGGPLPGGGMNPMMGGGPYPPMPGGGAMMGGGSGGNTHMIPRSHHPPSPAMAPPSPAGARAPGPSRQLMPRTTRGSTGGGRRLGGGEGRA